MVLRERDTKARGRHFASSEPRSSSPFALLAMAVAAPIVLALACETKRSDQASVSYVSHVQSLFEKKCVRCHAGIAAAGGWTADSYLGAIGCSASGEPVSIPGPAGTPPLLRALDRNDHAGIVTSTERTLLVSWLANGTPLRGGGVHPTTFADPRSPESHGRLLRARGWSPMLDPKDPDACGTCHDGAPTRPDRVAIAATHAPACTSCHREPNAALACGTCHGEGARSYPPRSRCFFPENPPDHAHAAHAAASASRAAGLPCSTCHPTPAVPGPSGVHGNGHADVSFDFAIAGREARFETTGKRCAGTCHARGGARATLAWTDHTPLTCNDCHTSPPPNHYRGACTSCHQEANADGTALVSPTLHVNGKLDLGDGSGKCGACHGDGEDAWPKTGAHAAHATPKGARPVECTACHEVPSAEQRHPEGRGGAAVRLSGLATRGGRRASFDPTTKTCAGTYCHEGSGATTPAPRWTDTSALTCTSCHGSPPPSPHARNATCGGAACHEGRTEGLAMTPVARLHHVDGIIDRAVP